MTIALHVQYEYFVMTTLTFSRIEDATGLLTTHGTPCTLLAIIFECTRLTEIVSAPNVQQRAKEQERRKER